jgi:hypothetical protein
VTFEYRTPEWEEARLKREAQDQDLSERLQRLIEHQWDMARRLREGLPEKPRPQLVLIRGGKDDDA